MKDLNLDEFFFDEDSYIKSDLKNINLSGLTDGKHLRSILISIFGNIYKLPKESLIKLCRVVELVHNATLTHDDVIDNSHTRRGNPSIPALINNKKSVLLGDYMLARALHELSDFNDPKLTSELTLTLKDLVEGEWIQYENTNPYEISSTLYTTLALKKTGSLFRWCFLAPLLADKKHISLYPLMQELGEELGVIFQMTDDIIDFNKDSKKTNAIDFRNNNINYVLQIVGTNHPEIKTKFLQTDDINELDDQEIIFIENALKSSKKNVQTKIENCTKLCDQIEKKLNLNDQASIDEIRSILQLLNTRIF